MAIPRVFISSTCYDLKHIRESLKYFVKTIGYEPVLSDDGDVYYNPSDHTHDSCLKEVETCQLFILIVGGRSGGKFKGTEDSITNTEYREAIRHNIPVFALVENAVYSDHHVYLSNKKDNPDIFETIKYPSVDNIKIFGFIDEVRKHSVNNAIYPFNNFLDIETYLRKQWAGMMYDFLLQRSNHDAQEVTNSLLDSLNLATRKSEELIKVLLKASDKNADKMISEIDNRVEAENFVALICKYFHIQQVNLSLDEIMQLPLADHWYNYLNALDEFKIVDDVIYDNHELMGIVHTKSTMAVTFEDAIDGEYKERDKENEAMAKAYSAFIKENDDSRKIILSNIALES